MMLATKQTLPEVDASMACFEIILYKCHDSLMFSKYAHGLLYFRDSRPSLFHAYHLSFFAVPALRKH
jgi:hypothetical protein